LAIFILGAPAKFQKSCTLGFRRVYHGLKLRVRCHPIESNDFLTAVSLPSRAASIKLNPQSLKDSHHPLSSSESKLTEPPHLLNTKSSKSGFAFTRNSPSPFFATSNVCPHAPFSNLANGNLENTFHHATYFGKVTTMSCSNFYFVLRLQPQSIS
jgi:hypothetical protein